MSFLLDTNVVSELARPLPNPKVLAWFEHLTELRVSAITIEELAYGVARARPRERRRLQRWFEALLAATHEIVAVDGTIAQLAGELRAARAATGRTVAQADMLIAASALRSAHTLVTRNTKDFAGCGVALLDPFG